MAQSHSADDGDMHTGVIPAGNDTARKGRKPDRWTLPGILSLVPGFGYLLLLFVFGFWLIKDPRATFLAFGPFKFTFVEIVLFLSAIVACAEILKVSQPGVNNTGEVIWMGAVALLQFGLIIASIYDERLSIFKSSESVEMFIINGVQTLVAFHVNSRSLVRTIANAPVAN